MKKQKNRCYVAGIVNERADWSWQGTVVSPNLREAKKMVVAFRKEMLDKKKVKNYQTEYDRIRAHLEDSATPHLIRSHVQSRADQLRALGARAVSGIQ